MINRNGGKIIFNIQEMKFPYGQILCIPISVFFALIKFHVCLRWSVVAGHMSQVVILPRQACGHLNLNHRTVLLSVRISIAGRRH